MPYRTPQGKHYHSVEGCCGAIEPCAAGGSLSPCSKCHGRGQGVIAGGVGGLGGGTGSYEEDLPGAYARKYGNSVEGYPHGVFKTADGIIRNRYGNKLTAGDVHAFLDESVRLRDEQERRVRGRANPRPEDVDYLGQLNLEVQCFEAAYADASRLEYDQKFWGAAIKVPPVLPDADDESFYDRRGTTGRMPKMVSLHDANGKEFSISSTRLSDVVDASLVALDEDAHACPLEGLAPDEVFERNKLIRGLWQRVPPCERPQAWHMPPLLGVGWDTPEQRRALADYLGIDDPAKLRRVGESIFQYCRHEFYDIKRSQRDGTPSDLALGIEEYIDCAPKWDGGLTYRGMAMDDRQVAEIMRAAETHGEYDPHCGGTGSWSTDYAFCKRWADRRVRNPRKGRNTKVVFWSQTQSRGTSVTHMSPQGLGEHEVLVSQSARYCVRRTEREPDGTLNVFLDEVA